MTTNRRSFLAMLTAGLSGIAAAAKAAQTPVVKPKETTKATGSKLFGLMTKLPDDEYRGEFSWFESSPLPRQINHNIKTP